MATVSTSLGKPRDETVRQFGQAALFALTAVAAGCCLYAVETWIFRCSHRFIDNPTEAMVRALGLAHFLVGWIYLASSPAVRSIRGGLRLGFWSAVGALLCLGYYRAGGRENPWMVAAFYSFFLVHEVRDQAELFFARQRTAVLPGRQRVIDWLCLAAGLLLVAILLGGLLFCGLLLRASPPLAGVHPAWPGLGLSMLALGGLMCGARFLQLGRHVYGDCRRLIAAIEPLLLVYASLAGILAAGSVLGSVTLNFIILIHVMTWLVYVAHKMSPAPATRLGWWTWLRRTRPGFLWLHLTVAVGFVILMALRVHVWDHAGLFSEMLGRSSFHYWSILHIAISFSRRPKG